MNRVIVRSVCGVGLALVLALGSTGRAQQVSVPLAHSSDLGSPRIERLADGTMVLTLIATGELRGLISVTLRQTDGQYSGDWAFTVAHMDDSDPATGGSPAPDHHASEPDPEEGHPHTHKDFVTLIQRGSLAGTIPTAALGFDADGKLVDLVAPLTISQGSLEFKGVSGSGRATLSTLSLVF